MADRRKIFDLFELYSEETEARVSEGIERYRKGDACFKIVDGNGNPVPNARIKVNQTAHEFRFGANIFMLDELETASISGALPMYSTWRRYRFIGEDWSPSAINRDMTRIHRGYTVVPPLTDALNFARLTE